MLDVPRLLSAVSEQSPCGDDLEYDAAFLELERITQGQPERQMGDAVLPAEPPEWPRVRDQACELFARSKDLRVATPLLQASLALEGLPGLAQSLQLISELLSLYWQDLYPRLDEDDNDPTFRINALTGLTAEPILRLLWETPLVRSRAFGVVSLRAAVNAYGLHRFASETLSQDHVVGALRDSDEALLSTTRDAVAQAQAAVQAIESQVSDQVGSAQGVDLGQLKQMLRQAAIVLGGEASASEAGETVTEAASTSEQSSAGSVARPAVSGEINSRDDVLRQLDRLLAYYSQHEPSSPVPVLLSRAKILVTADFATIVRNLIPDGMSQFEALRGPDSE
ncbi:MAG: type VI secretion system protein TssA [Pseudomonas sp.]